MPLIYRAGPRWCMLSVWLANIMAYELDIMAHELVHITALLVSDNSLEEEVEAYAQSWYWRLFWAPSPHFHKAITKAGNSEKTSKET